MSKMNYATHPDYQKHPQHRFMGGPLIRLLELLRARRR